MGCCTDYYKTISAINCRTLMAVEKFEIWIPEFDSSGVANKISIADAKLLASWVAKINASGSSNKFYPLPFMDNIVDERADDVFESLDSGANINVKQGDRDFLGFFIQEPNCILSEVEAWQSAGTWGKYVIDKDGNILYRYCSTDPLNMFPIMVDDKSLSAQLVKPTYSTSMKHKVAYRYRQTERDGDIRVLPAKDLDFDPLTSATFKGLVNVMASYSSITVTGFTATLIDCFNCPITGLVAGDFSITDSTGASVVITSVTETGSTGVYAFVIPTQTSAEVLTLIGSKTGLNFQAVEAKTILIP